MDLKNSRHCAHWKMIGELEAQWRVTQGVTVTHTAQILTPGFSMPLEKFN